MRSLHREMKPGWDSLCAPTRTVHHGEPRRVVRDADGVPRQAGVLPRVVGGDVLQSQDLHVLVRGVHTCSLYRVDGEIQTCIQSGHQSAENEAAGTNKISILGPEPDTYCSIYCMCTFCSFEPHGSTRRGLLKINRKFICSFFSRRD